MGPVRRTLTLACLATALIAVAPALTDMALDLDRSAAATAWVVTGYFVSAAVLTPVLGRVGDLLGRRRVLTWSILLYAFSAFAAGYSTSLWMLLVLRTTTFVGVCVEFVAATAW